MLVALVEMEKLLTRKDDFVVRYGVEGFVVILSERSFCQAMKKAELLCKLIAKTGYQVDDAKLETKLCSG